MVDGDKFIEDPVPVLQGVERFLHIPSFYTDQHFTYNGDSSHWENHKYNKSLYYKEGKATRVLSWMLTPWRAVCLMQRLENTLRLVPTPEII